VEDDDGSGTRGTPGNKVAYHDARETAIDDQTHSTTNTGRKPWQTTDEVVTAGTQGAASDTHGLNDRISAHAKPDGTLLIPSTWGTKAALQGAVGNINLIADDTFLCWPGGDNDPAGHWTDLGDPTVDRETTIIKLGTMCLKLTNNTGADGVGQSILDSGVFDDLQDSLDGVSIGFGCWVYTGLADHAYVEIYDGSDLTETTARHAGGSDWTWLSGVHKIVKGATQLEFRCRVSNDDKTNPAYFSGATALISETAPANWVPSRKQYRAVHWHFDGTLATTNTVRKAFVSRPTVWKDVQGYVTTAPGAGNAWNIRLTKNNSFVEYIWNTGALISTTAKAGRRAPNPASYDKQCFAGNSGTIGTTGQESMISLDCSAVGDAADGDLYVRYIQWTRPLEDFLAYNDIGGGTS
jgi:hypothetical protein